MKTVLLFSIIVVLVLQTSVAVTQDVSTDRSGVKDIAWSPDGTRIADIYGDSKL